MKIIAEFPFPDIELLFVCISVKSEFEPPFTCLLYILQLEKVFENALKDTHGCVIKKMANDGACLFRAVGEL